MLQRLTNPLTSSPIYLSSTSLDGLHRIRRSLRPIRGYRIRGSSYCVHIDCMTSNGWRASTPLFAHLLGQYRAPKEVCISLETLSQWPTHVSKILRIMNNDTTCLDADLFNVHWSAYCAQQANIASGRRPLREEVFSAQQEHY